jgi:tight adherence protein B
MLSPALLFPLTFVFAAGSVGGILFAAFYPRVKASTGLDRQLELISGAGTGFLRGSKRAVEATLREAEEKAKLRKNRSKPPLLVRMRQGSISWSTNVYYLISVATGITAFLFFLIISGLGLLPSAGFGLSAGLLLPHWYVKFRRKRRFKHFTTEFPNGIDIIVRGIKAGLPLGDCLRVIATETQEPVKGEFKTLIEDHTLGLPIDEAVQRLPDRIPLVEASLFAIVIAIQSRTGGNLSEALGNLSRVLRERKKMHGKIKAMSGEAKASAMIIASLPFAVIGVLSFTSPEYVTLLFTTPIGKIVLVACGFMMVTGILTMRKMINFDF